MAFKPAPILKCSDVLKGLEKAKADHEKRCETDASLIREEWFQGVVNIDLKNGRDGKENTKYFNIEYTDPILGTKVNSLCVKFSDEKNMASIAPIDPDELAEVNKRLTSKGFQMELRTMKPSITFEKYVGLPKHKPGEAVEYDKYEQSCYFKMIELINEAYVYQFNQKIELGEKFAAVLKEVISKNASGKPEEHLADPRMKEFPPNIDAMILCVDDMTKATRTTKWGSNPYITNPQRICLSNVKVTNMVQEVNGKKSATPGSRLDNPKVRVNIAFRDAGATKIYDATRVKVSGGKKELEMATFDGKPIDERNVSKFLTRLSVVGGIVNLSVCASSMGISIPQTAKILSVNRVEFKEMGSSELFDDEVVAQEKIVVSKADAEDDFFGEDGGEPAEVSGSGLNPDAALMTAAAKAMALPD